MLESFTDLPWKAQHDPEGGELYWSGVVYEGDGYWEIRNNQNDADCYLNGDLESKAKFIAIAPQIISELVEEVEKLREALEGH